MPKKTGSGNVELANRKLPAGILPAGACLRETNIGRERGSRTAKPGNNLLGFAPRVLQSGITTDFICELNTYTATGENSAGERIFEKDRL